MFKLLVWMAVYGSGISITTVEFSNRADADRAFRKIKDGAGEAGCDVPNVLKLYDDEQGRF